MPRNANELFFERIEATSTEEELIEIAKREKFEVNNKNENGETPLHLAAKMGFITLIQLLLNNGADPDILNNENETPSYIASVHKNEEARKILRNATHNKRNNKKPISSPTTTNNQTTQLSPNPSPLETQPPSNEQITHDDPEKAVILAPMPKFKNTETEIEYSLYNAVLNNDIEETEELLDAGADSNAKDKNGKTLLHLAINLQHSEIAEKLLTYGANIDIPDNDGVTAFQAAEALKDKNPRIIRMMVQTPQNETTQLLDDPDEKIMAACKKAVVFQCVSSGTGLSLGIATVIIAETVPTLIPCLSNPAVCFPIAVLLLLAGVLIGIAKCIHTAKENKVNFTLMPGITYYGER